MNRCIQKIMLYKQFWLIVGVVFLLTLPLYFSASWTSISIEILIMSLSACALNLMVGYTGLVSFGPAGLYAVGAYTTAILLTKTSISFPLAMISGPIIAGFFGLIVGWFCVRRTAVYFALLTLAFSQIIWTIIFEWYSFTGGDNGIVGLPTPDFLFSMKYCYYFTLVLVAVCISIIFVIIKSPFGKTLQAIRENPNRVEFIGTNVKLFQLVVFIIASFFLGAAGSIYGVFSGSVFPDYAHWAKSTDMLVVCLLGGINSFAGPIIGSIIYIIMSKIISSFTMYWALFLGIIIIFLVLYMPNGVAGYLSEKIALFGSGGNRKD